MMKEINNKTGLEIAVIGLSGRFPKAENINEFWNNLINDVECISKFTDTELVNNGIPSDWIADKSYVKSKGYLDGVEYFDNDFFNYTPKEAAEIDPQIRTLLECSWNALENAAYNPETYNGLIGFFAGAGQNIFWVNNLLKNTDLNSKSIQHKLFQNMILSDRFLSSTISYKLNLKGPSLTIDTACSTSLVAVHLASQSLLCGECDMALAGGVSISLPLKSGYFYQEGMIASPDGHCRTFDNKAEGTVFGDGAAVVVLKRLDDALQDNDNIYAVIKGSSINNDGSNKIGFTAPGVDGQKYVINAAHMQAEINPETISYIEAHGTGTTIGDPIELEALEKAFNTQKKQYCRIGSVKTNVGHLNTAAGITGFIKTVLSLKNKKIPASLHLNKPNSKFDFTNSPFIINDKLFEWKRFNHPLRAGVSSFGIGGTNAHVVLEEAPITEKSINNKKYQLLFLSAKTEKALEKVTDNMIKFLEDNKDLNISDVCYTLQVGRRVFQYKKLLICEDINSTIDNLKKNTNVYSGYSNQNNPDIVFMFPDEESICINMGYDLYKSEKIFKKEVDSCFEIIKLNYNYDLKKDFLDNSNEIREKLVNTQFEHILLFIIEYALAKLLMYWGIKPVGLIGHGIGEYSAAFLGDVFNINDAFELLKIRSKIIKNPTDKTILNEYINKINKINLNTPFIPYISTLTGDWENDVDAVNPDCWIQRLNKAVKFSKGFDNIVKNKKVIFIEVGPCKVLCDEGNQMNVLHQNKHKFINLMRDSKGKTDDLYNLLKGIGQLWLEGVTIDWNNYFEDEKYRRVSLPTYPFDKKYFPVENNNMNFISNGNINKTEIDNKLNDIGDWFYYSSWEKSIIPINDITFENEKYLLFCDDYGIGEKIINKMSLESNNCIIVKKSNEYSKNNEKSYSINSKEKNNYFKLFQDLQKQNIIPGKILFLWGISDNDNESNMEQIKNTQYSTLLSSILIAKGIDKYFKNKNIQIIFITNNIFKIIEEKKLSFSKATLLSFIKNIQFENSFIQCKCIDLDIEDLNNYNIDKFLDYLFWDITVSYFDDNIIAYRSGSRWIQTTKSVKLNKSINKQTILKKDGTYLIVGDNNNFIQDISESFINKGMNIAILPINSDNKNDCKLQINFDMKYLFEKINFIQKKIKKEIPLENHQNLHKNVEELCLSYIYNYFDEKIDISVGKIYEKKELQEKLNIIEKFNKLYEYFICILKNNNLIKENDKKIIFLETKIKIKDPSILNKEISNNYSSFSGQLRLLDHCIKNYDKAISGQIWSSGVLYSDTKLNILNESYKDSILEIEDNIILKLYEELILNILKKHNNKKIKILEVGGGTGLIIQRFAPLLKDYDIEYYFTDINKTFISYAEKFALENDYNFIKFGIFDITEDPINQGFNYYDFDIISALNVIHATKSISETINNLQKLLIPGGIICILERVKIRSYVDLIWGLIDGWWSFEDEDRKLSPIMEIEKWENILHNSGFINIKSYPEDVEIKSNIDVGLVIAQQDNKLNSVDYKKWLKKNTKNENDFINKELEISEYIKNKLINFKNIDITKSDQLENAIYQIENKFGNINGVIYCSKNWDKNNLIINSDINDLQDVLISKINSIILLSDFFKNKDIDFFSFWSSIETILNKERDDPVNYNFIYEFIDIFCDFNNSVNKIFTTSINWSGLVFKSNKYFNKNGLKLDSNLILDNFITFEEVFDSFIRIIENKQQKIIISPADLILKINKQKKNKKLNFIDNLNNEKNINDLDSNKADENIEQKLIRVWKQFFGLENIKINDNFFDLGGDSLKAISLVSLIKEKLKLNFSLTDLFNNPTIKNITENIKKNESIDEKLPTIVEDPKNKYLPFPLTEIQQAYYLGRFNVFELGNIASHGYTEINYFDLDLDKFECVFNKIIQRHDMLRAIILQDGTQKILENVPEYKIKTLDLRDMKNEEIKKELDSIRAQMSHQVMDTGEWPLFEIRATYLSDNKIRLHTSIDFLITDAWSLHVLYTDLLKLYEDPNLILEPINLSFRDYIIAKKKVEESFLYKKSKNYWAKQIEQLPLAPELPIIKEPGEITKPEFRRWATDLDSSKWKKIKNYAKEIGVTETGIVLAIFSEVLKVYNRKLSFTLNLTFFNRLPMHKEVNNIIGDFTSLLLLGVNNNNKDNFKNKAIKMQKKLWENMDHFYYSGINMINDLGKFHNYSSAKALMPIVFTSTLGFEKFEKETTVNKPETIKIIKDEEIFSISQTPQVWLDHQVAEIDGNLHINWDVIAELFPDGFIDDMFSAYCEFLNDLADNKELWDEKYPLLKNNLRYKELLTFKEKEENVSDEMLHTLFDKKVIERPEGTAVISKEKRLTYKELDHIALCLANKIKENKVKPNDLVGIVMEKGWEQIPGVLGILKSGGAYLPVDAKLPKDRIWYLLENGKVNVVLTQSGLKNNLSWPKGIKVISVDENYLKENKPDSIKYNQTPDDLAYIIYTSGSTGKPKGVMIDHRGAVNTILDINRRFNVNNKDRAIGLSSLGFDLSVYDIFGMLSAGGAIVIPDKYELKNPEYWLKQIGAEKVTIWNTVPAFMNMLVEYAEGYSKKIPESLRLVLMSGDWIPVELPDKIKKLRSGIEVISLGGATEASIWSIIYPIGKVKKGWKSIPYGKALKNQRFYVLNSHYEPCRTWVPGELYIGGVGLAKGYWQDKEMTNLKFITHPISKERIYKTGDIGRYLPDGNIEFMGREDFQVKIRGYRVELGEIENVILKDKKIKETVVIIKEEKDKTKNLCCYYTSEKKIDLNIFRKKIQKELPDYMIPTYFIELKKIPLTSNGKIDRNNLPDPISIVSKKSNHIKPTNKIEKKLVEIWKKILDVDRVGIKDNFFDLGGHSLKAINIISIINKEFNINLPLVELFTNPYIKNIAKYLNDTKKKSENLPIIQIDSDNKYLPFALTDIQQAYLLGRSEVFELGNVATHGYSELGYFNLDLEKISFVFNKLIQRHDMLRVIILPDSTQKILENVPEYKIKTLDLRDKKNNEIKKKLDEIRLEMSHQIIQLDKWPLFEIRATILKNNKIFLHISFDALIGDAWSMQLLFSELFKLYENPELKLKNLSLSFRDYILGLIKVEETSLYKKSEKYWKRQIKTLPPAPELPFIKDPGKIKKPEFTRKIAVLKSEKWENIKDFSKKYNITEAGILLTIFSEVISIFSRKLDHTLNLTFFNRIPIHDQVNDIVGDFTSSILLGITNNLNDSFCDKAKSIQKKLWENIDHRYYSGVKVIRDLSKLHESNIRKALMPVVFTSMLGLSQNNEMSENNELALLKQINDEDLYSISQTPQVWLDHQVSEVNGALHFNWDVVEELFPDGFIDDMFSTYCMLLNDLADNKELWNEKSPLLKKNPRYNEMLNFKENETKISDEMLHTLFDKKVKELPNSIAVISKEIRLTYEELDHIAVCLSHKLYEKKVQPNELVAVVMDKGWEEIPSVLGILKSGGAYLPIDAKLPADRIWYLLKNGKVNVVLTQSKLKKDLSWPDGIKVINVDDRYLKEEKKAPLEYRQNKDDLAYVIYTSGSTGKPKGVMIDHRGAVNTIQDINERFKVSNNDKVIGLSSLGFDLSVYDIFGMLSAGGTIVIPDKDELKNPEYWLNLIESERITIWNTVPAFMNMLVEYAEGYSKKISESLRLVLMSGDWIPVELPGKIKKLSSGIEVISLGGATEASIWSIMYPIGEVKKIWKSIPYGKALKNQRFYVLNERFEPCPSFVPGELYIGGAGLAKGYWGDKEKTDSRFIIHPLTNERIYRTGDIGRYLPDGNIEFMGREDFQVKIQGHRIELGEIETALNNFEGINKSIVDVYKDKSGVRKLIAYIIEKKHDIKNEKLLGYENFINDPIKRIEFKLAQKGLEEFDSNKKRIQLNVLDTDIGIPFDLNNKKYFNLNNKKIKFEEISNILTCLKSSIIEDIPLSKYYYPSAGSLYPVQLYIYAAKNSIEGIECGYYYYDRKKHELVLLNNDEQKGVVNSQLYFVAKLNAIEPMYGPIADSFCRIESGHMSQLIILNAFNYGIGLNEIELDKNQIIKHINLNDEYQVNIFFEIGKTKNTGIAEYDGKVFIKNIERQSYRHFKLNDIISLKSFNKSIINVLNSFSLNLNLEIYFYIKKNAIEGLACGYYKYNKKLKKLEIINNKETKFNTNLFQGINKKIYEESGFAVFFTAESDENNKEISEAFHSSIAKNDNDLIKVGQIGQNLMMASLIENIGLCPIGFFNSGPLKKLLKYSENEGIIYTFLGGRISEKQKQVWEFADEEKKRENSYDEIKKYLNQFLPEYMVPKIYINIPKIPLSPNGKINRKLLPMPNLNEKKSAKFIKPTNEVEIQLASIWKEILKIEKIGINDNFFEMGGNSLQAISLISKIKENFKINISIENVFKKQTIFELSKIIISSKNEILILENILNKIEDLN